MTTSKNAATHYKAGEKALAIAERRLSEKLIAAEHLGVALAHFAAAQVGATMIAGNLPAEDISAYGAQLWLESADGQLWLAAVEGR